MNNDSGPITSKQFAESCEAVRRIGVGLSSGDPTGFELLSIAVAGCGFQDSVAAALRDIADSLKEVASAIREEDPNL